MKRLFSLSLGLALCLHLAACSATYDAPGKDWRTTGVVVGSGTITRGGEDVDVLVTVSEKGAAFYRDLPERVLLDDVSFPRHISGAEQAFSAVSFRNIDGDGESDVQMRFINENGDSVELTWTWDPAGRYVFREDLSAAIADDECTDTVEQTAFRPL